MRGGIVIGPLSAALIFCAGMYAVLRLHESGPAPGLAGPRPMPAAAQAAGRAPAAAGLRPSFDIVRVGPDGEAVIAGRAEPGARVTVFDGRRPLGSVTADPSGAWLLIPKAPLTAGKRKLSLEAADPTTGAKTTSVKGVALSVPVPISDRSRFSR